MTECSRCGANEVREGVQLNKYGINYLSGLIVKTKPIKGNVCLVCGKVDMFLEDPQELTDKELVAGTSSNYLPFIMFALFVLSLQLD
ncbi:MAG TPA: hypothetical protein VNU93_02860 [Verrucomicrobiae bacterium]|nr:hypothetical protein [Verrucomicrobiae bacterium]